MASEFNELLKQYYDTNFPYQLIYNWLNYKDGEYHIDGKVVALVDL